MKKGGGSESTIIVGPSKSVLIYALHSLEYVLGLARFRVFMPKLYYYMYISVKNMKTIAGIDSFIDSSIAGFPTQVTLKQSSLHNCVAVG